MKVIKGGIKINESLGFALVYFILLTLVLAQSDTTSEITTREIMVKRIADTLKVSSRSTDSFRYQPIPPAPKYPNTVAARKTESQV